MNPPHPGTIDLDRFLPYRLSVLTNLVSGTIAGMGIRTAQEFARLPEAVVNKKFTKPGQEIWRELRGESVYPVTAEEKSAYASISKTKTFAPPTNDPEYLFAHLLRNLESACMKARRYHLAPRKLIGFLKMNDFEYRGSEMKLTRPSAHPLELCETLRGLFDELYRREDIYRATAVILVDLVPDHNVQYSLYESPMRADKVRDLYEAVDEMRENYLLPESFSRGRTGNAARLHTFQDGIS